MPAPLPKNVEAKRSFSISIEQTWGARFIIACHNLSLRLQKKIVASKLVRDYIIKKTVEFEKKIEEIDRGKRN